jgi:hypothetical protein
VPGFVALSILRLSQHPDEIRCLIIGDFAVLVEDLDHPPC